MRQTGRRKSPSPRRQSNDRLDTDVLIKKRRKQPRTKFVSLSKYDRIKDEVHKRGLLKRAQEQIEVEIKRKEIIDNITNYRNPSRTITNIESSKMKTYTEFPQFKRSPATTTHSGFDLYPAAPNKAMQLTMPTTLYYNPDQNYHTQIARETQRYPQAPKFQGSFFSEDQDTRDESLRNEQSQIMRSLNSNKLPLLPHAAEQIVSPLSGFSRSEHVTEGPAIHNEASHASSKLRMPGELADQVEVVSVADLLRRNKAMSKTSYKTNTGKSVTNHSSDIQFKELNTHIHAFRKGLPDIIFKPSYTYKDFLG